MHKYLKNAFESDALGSAQAAAFSDGVAYPDLVTNDVPLPDADVGGLRCEVQALLALLELAGEHTGPREIAAQLVCDSHQKKQEQETDRERHRKHSTVQQLGKEDRHDDRAPENDADDFGTPTVAPSPGGGSRVQHENEEQNGAEVGNVCPRIFYPDRRYEHVAPCVNRTQPGDLEKVQIWLHAEVEHADQHTEAADQPGKPETTRLEIEPDEPDQRDHHHAHRHMHPSQQLAELSGRGGPHERQLQNRDRCRGGRRDREGQVGPRAPRLGPYQQVHARQRQADAGDAGPDYGNPAHSRRIVTVSCCPTIPNSSTCRPLSLANG